MAFSDFKKKLVGLFGEDNSSSNDVSDHVGRLMRHHVVYHWPRLPGGVVDTSDFYSSNTASIPIVERVIYSANRQCRIKSAFLHYYGTCTTTSSDTKTWTLVLNKRGGSRLTTASSTYTATVYVAGITNETNKNLSLSNSQSVVVTTAPAASNRWRLNRMHLKPANLQMAAGDVLTAKVLKGVGVSGDVGAVFRGGSIRVEIEEEE